MHNIAAENKKKMLKRDIYVLKCIFFISLDQLLAVMSFNQLIETGRSSRGENSIILSVLPITQSLKRKKKSE